MNITLTDVLTRINGQTNQSGAAGNAASASAIAKQLQTSAVLNSLVSGQTIGGRISSVDGRQILLDMGDGVEINARLDSDMKAAVGRQMLFEVKGNSDDKLTLSPLYTNLSAGKSAAAGALNAAGMPLTGENMAMVNSMMEEGLPIDKESLWLMGKLAADFPQASADTIVRLTAMGMEVNETNVMQYEATQNMQHQLLYRMNDITEGLSQVLSSFGEEGKPVAGLQFMKDLLHVLQTGEIAEEAAGVKELQREIESLMKEIGEGKGAVPSEGREGQQGLTGREAEAAKVLQQLADEDGMVLVKDGAKMTEQGRLKLPDELEHRLESLQKEFTGQLKNLLSKEWTIKPENFSDKEEVKNFYQKIKNQAGQMQEVFAAAGKAESSAGQALQQMNQNLQFMDNVNQMFPYLQIPLKASMENAHGELYVYQKKKGKVSEDGSSSALLHLEMEHLGNMDIYVKMKDYNVSTQFTLANEKVLDFLAEHIHVLNERLEKKGYHMQSEMKYKEEERQENVMSRIRGMEEHDTMVSYTAFDVRA